MRIKLNTVIGGVLIVLGIIIFVGGLRYTFDIIVDPLRDNPDTFAIGGLMAICLGLAPLIYGILTIRDDILHRKLGAKSEYQHNNKDNNNSQIH
jgi:hypothetical protein